MPGHRVESGLWAPGDGPLKRRCLYHWIEYPTVERAAEIVRRRVPGADVNPYLAYAALLAAGLHGIEQKPLVGFRDIYIGQIGIMKIHFSCMCLILCLMYRLVFQINLEARVSRECMVM